VIWSAIGRGAAGCGAVRHTVDVGKGEGSYRRSTLRRQRRLFALVWQAVWGAQAGSGSRLRGRHNAGGSNAEDGRVGGAVGVSDSPRMAATLCNGLRGGAWSLAVEGDVTVGVSVGGGVIRCGSSAQ
jgi:hypothetical protein